MSDKYKRICSCAIGEDTDKRVHSPNCDYNKNLKLRICNCDQQVDSDTCLHRVDCNWRNRFKRPIIPEATRELVNYRFDVLDPAFLKAMALIGSVGAAKYGDFNWQKSRLDGAKGPINHIYNHLDAYRRHTPYDHQEIGCDRKYHLAAIAFNAMMEFWYECAGVSNVADKSNP